MRDAALSAGCWLSSLHIAGGATWRMDREETEMRRNNDENSRRN